MTPAGKDPPKTYDDDVPQELRDALTDPHGRYALAYLSRAGRPVDIDELSRGVVSLIERIPRDDVDDHIARHVGTWLHHGSLSVLDEYGVVKYDPDDGRVWLLDHDWGIS